MPRSIKVQTGYVDTIRIAVRRNGFQTQRALAERAGYSLATVKKFLGGKPVDFATFTELCETLNVDWETIADLGNGLPAGASPGSSSPADTLPAAPPARSADGEAEGSQAVAPTSPSPVQAQTRSPQDWGAAVDVSVFYGREQALTTLEEWIERDRTRLVALCGIGGIGKTTLTAKLARHLAERFDYLIWRSLKNAPPVQETLKNLLNFFLEQPDITLPENEVADTLDAQLRQLIDCARTHRCLIVLDGVEALFEEGDRAGTYRTGYAGYDDLFKTIGETDHNSCFIITSRELPKEIALQAGDAQPIRCFQLSGLAEANGQQLLETLGELNGTEQEWTQLIQAYSGHPLALKMIAAAVRDYFDGDISSFLALAQEDSLVFGDIRQLLVRQINRLTPLEKDLMYWLAINREPVAWQTLQADLVDTVPLNKILQAVDSLERRSLIERHRSSITQQAVIMDYFTGELIHQICHEIHNRSSNFLQRYALVKANARDYIRQAQTRLILSPIVKQICDLYSTPQAITTALTEQLTEARQQPKKVGYVGGNTLTLLRHLNIDLTGYDFSNLAIWQAYLQGITLHDVNFTGSDLSRSVFNQPFGSIRTMSFRSDGKVLATGDTNSEIWLWQTAFSATSRDIKSHISTLQGHQNWVCSVAFSPDGTRLVSGSADRTIKLWAAQTGELLRTLTGHEHGVWTVAFSPDGRSIASGSADQTVRVWETATGTCQQILSGHNNWVWIVAFSPDGRSIASGSADQTVRLWDIQAQQCLRVLPGHSNWVWSVAFSPDGQALASGSEDRTMRLWNAVNGQCLQTLQGSSNWVWSVAFSPDGKKLASGQGDRLVHLWDMPTGEPVETLAGAQNAIWSVTFSPDGNWLASGNEDGNVHLWQATEDRAYRRLSGHSKSIWSVAFDAKGETIASGSADQSIKLWDVQTGKCRHTLTEHQHWVCSVAFHPQKNILASGSYDRTLKLWDLASGQCIDTWTGHTSGIWCIAFSPSGDFLASSSIDQTVRVWDVGKGTCQQVLTGHENWVMSVAISPDGQWIASGSADHTVRLWAAESGQLVHVLTGHTNSVWSVAFSPNGKYLASGSDDKTIKLWALESGDCICTLQNKEPYEGMTITGVTGVTESEIATLEQLGAINQR